MLQYKLKKNIGYIIMLNYEYLYCHAIHVYTDVKTENRENSW